MTNKSNTVLVRGALSTSKKCYILTTKILPMCIQKQSTELPMTMALYTRVPDIETWHHHLGHCNTQAIVDMVKKGMTQGMLIDLSLLPPDCDHCALSKQMHSTIPKMWEGPKSDKCLGRVYTDLCGPMPVASHTRSVYAMNIIDDSPVTFGVSPPFEG